VWYLFSGAEGDVNHFYQEIISASTPTFHRIPASYPAHTNTQTQVQAKT